MKRQWEIDELIEHWTLHEDEVTMLTNKQGANRLGCAILLKFFQLEAKFPTDKHDVPKEALAYIAKQVDVQPELFLNYEWCGRTFIRHRTQIREFLGWRKATVEDAQKIVQWLIEQVLGHEQNVEHLKALVGEWLRKSQIEPPTELRIDRLVRSAIRTYETNFFQQTFAKFLPETLAEIDLLLATTSSTESTSSNDEQVRRTASALNDLKADAGRVGLESVLTEVAKLQNLRRLKLPSLLFTGVSPKILQTYKQKVVSESPGELRARPPAIRYTLIAAFCYLRSQEITDSLVELLLTIVHRLGTKAETKVEKELLAEFKRVTGKTELLYQIAEAALAEPEGVVKDVVYPVAGKQTLIDLVKEFKSTGNAYRQKVYTIMRSSYSNYYRRMVPRLLDVLEFCSNNDIHRPVIQAVELLKK